jgi:hypothetical protein
MPIPPWWAPRVVGTALVLDFIIRSGRWGSVGYCTEIRGRSLAPKSVDLCQARQRKKSVAATNSDWRTCESRTVETTGIPLLFCANKTTDPEFTEDLQPDNYIKSSPTF